MSIADKIKTADAASGAWEGAGIPDSFWRSLKQLNAFRFFLAVFIAALAFFPERLQLFEIRYHNLLYPLSIYYLALAIGFRLLLSRRMPSFTLQLVMQLTADILFITTFIHFSGGTASGLGLLLTVPMAAAGLHPRTRIAFFLAAMATIAVLLEQSLTLSSLDDFGSSAAASGYLHAAMLAVGFFTVAGISHLLAKGALASAEDAAVNARAAIELERINARVIQDLPYGVVVIGPDGTIILFNQRAETLLCGKPPLASMLSRCDRSLDKLWREWSHADGPEVAVLSVGEPVRRVRIRLSDLSADRSDGAVMFIEDISELEQEAIHMKLASLGRLTANLAHEIRNPLSAINHASQLLREDAGHDLAINKLTRIIEDNVMRLNSLVEDVLLMSRRDRQNREVIALEEYLSEFVAQFRQSEEVGEGVICTDVEPGLSIEFDRLHLHQILWNLMRNAHRHCSRRECSIRISAATAGDMGRVEIYNDGPAIPAEMRQRLFEPFYSTDRAGTGLGLYIALELAEANDGQLRCVEQNQGARFWLNARLHR